MEESKIKKWIYHAEGDNTCDKCMAYNGKEFKTLEEAPKLPIHPNCDCWLEPVDHEICENCEHDIETLEDLGAEVLDMKAEIE